MYAHVHVRVCTLTNTCGYCRMVREYHKLEESRDGVLKEKQAYEVQLELLQRTVHEYEELMTSKVSLSCTVHSSI